MIVAGYIGEQLGISKLINYVLDLIKSRNN